MRTALWGIFAGGLMPVLLWTAAVEAQGGLPACQASLRTCQADLNACKGELATCTTFPGDGVDGPVLQYVNEVDTFTDVNTQLMWEKKVAGGGAGTCLTNLHGADSTCTWTEATGAWIAAINAAKLGGHNDWRVPNIKELQSIVDYGQSNPASSVPGSTASNPFFMSYWSITSIVTNPTSAWTVDFGSGDIVGWLKTQPFPVRAVRGGQ